MDYMITYYSHKGSKIFIIYWHSLIIIFFSFEMYFPENSTVFNSI